MEESLVDIARRPAAFPSTCTEFSMLCNVRSFFAGRRGATLVESLIVIVIVAILLIAAVQAIGGPADLINIPRRIFFRETVIGIVTAPPASKLQFVEGGETKFSINLNTADGRIIVNCSSTQCASLQAGQVVVLSCYKEFHLAEPNETECRYQRLMPDSSQ